MARDGKRRFAIIFENPGIGGPYSKQMTRILIPLCLLMAILPCRAGWQALFNGKDLTGWSGDPRLWRVEDGVLIGETDDAGRKINANSFLIWQGGEPGDFELEFQARVTGNNNSGVQYRSRVVDPAKWIVGGYQMDLHPQATYLGMLYEEKGRGIACQRGQRVKLGDTPEVTASLEVPAVDLAVWNSYRIVAQGQMLSHFINGKLAAEIQDVQPEKRAAKGVIALQVHAGPAMKTEFKNLRIQQGVKAEPGGKPTAVWIWKSAQPTVNEKVFFRREFQLPADVASAALTVVCDDEHRLLVNGMDLGRGIDWKSPRSYEVLAHLKPGSRNVIAVEGRNKSGAAGMALSFRATLNDGKKLHIVSDSNWLCSGDSSDGWQNPGFPAASWAKAVVVAKMGDTPWAAAVPLKTE